MAEQPKAAPARMTSQIPFRERLKYAAIAYLLFAVNKLVHRGTSLFRLLRPSRHAPSQVKHYSCRPRLEVHVFIPSSHNAAAQPKTRLPVLLTVHGGGYVLGNPEDNEVWNRNFADRYGVLVVGLNYSKAPVSPFPKAIHDLEALVHAVLADQSLPSDTSRVAMGGWSAGGNLTMAVASLPSLRGRIHAIVPVYPPTDFTVTAGSKALARQYKPFQGFRGRKVDYLLPLAPIFNWAYLPPLQDRAGLANPLLSPEYQSKDLLPPYVFILACELDMLGMEAWRTASLLAGRPEPQASVIGKSDIGKPGELILDDERFAFETRTENSSHRWLLVPDVVHGFDAGIGKIVKKSDPLIEDSRIKTDKGQAIIAEWLFKGPFR